MRRPGDRTARTYLIARRQPYSQRDKRDPRFLILKCHHGRFICLLWGMYWAMEGEGIIGPYDTQEECEVSTVGHSREN